MNIIMEVCELFVYTFRTYICMNLYSLCFSDFQMSKKKERPSHQLSLYSGDQKRCPKKLRSTGLRHSRPGLSPYRLKKNWCPMAVVRYFPGIGFCDNIKYVVMLILCSMTDCTQKPVLCVLFRTTKPQKCYRWNFWNAAVKCRQILRNTNNLIEYL